MFAVFVTCTYIYIYIYMYICIRDIYIYKYMQSRNQSSNQLPSATAPTVLGSASLLFAHWRREESFAQCGAAAGGKCFFGCGSKDGWFGCGNENGLFGYDVLKVNEYIKHRKYTKYTKYINIEVWRAINKIYKLINI